MSGELMRQRSFSSEDFEQEMESLKTRVVGLQAQLSSMMTDRERLQELLKQAHHQELSHLESSKRQVEEEVLKAQKVVSEACLTSSHSPISLSLSL